jgi:hypothetical protein
MTTPFNPFLEEAKKKGIFPSSTGNPFIDSVYPHAGRDYDSVAWAMGKSALGGLLMPITGPSHWLQKIEDQFPNDPFPVFTQLAKVGDSLEPNLAQDASLAAKAGVVGAGLAGGLITGGLEFKGIAGALDLAASKFGGTAATRATMAIAKIAENITIKARELGASEGVANTLGNAARVLPRNVATGLTMDIANNPNQTGTGMATNAALTAGLSLMEGALYRKISPRLFMNPTDGIHFNKDGVKIDPNDPDFVQRIQSKIGGLPVKDRSIPSPDDIYFQVVNRNKPFQNLEKDLASQGAELSTAEKPSAVSSMANGVGVMIKKFNDNPFTFDENMNPVPILGPDQKPMEGLKTIFQPLETPELRQKLDAYALSKIVTDKADLGTSRTTYRNKSQGTTATAIETQGGETHIDYPDRLARHPDFQSAHNELIQNDYQKVGPTRPMPSPEKVTDGISIKDALQTTKYIEENYPEVAQAHAKLMNYMGAVRQFAQTSGLLTDRGLRMFEALEQNHISLQSLVDGKIASPTYSAIQNTGTVIKAGINNLIKDKIIDIADNFPEQAVGWIKKEKIPDAKQTPMWQQVNKIKENLGKYGLDYKMMKVC